MPVPLLDVNALIALAWSHHVHHEAVRNWFTKVAAGGWATCPITQCGFVRISSNPRIMGAAASPSQAVEALQRLLEQSGHVFWPDDVQLIDRQFVSHQLLVGHQQVTDLYLIALAMKHNGALATLDRNAAQLAPTGAASVVSLIAA